MGVIRTSTTEEKLRSHLRRDGMTERAIDAIWPKWWSTEAEQSVSARAELHFSLARRLALPPQSLFNDQPKFIWRRDAKYKNLGDLGDLESALLASFCVGFGRHLISSVRSSFAVGDTAPLPSAAQLRDILLRERPVVDLHTLLVFCWGVGIPIVQLSLFPLRNKGLHAVTTRSGDRFAIMIGRITNFRAQACFWIAHEIGHIALGHLGDSCALLDVEDPLGQSDDEEERAADEYALELLTGAPQPTIDTGSSEYTASQLARAVDAEGTKYAIDPAILALCTAHQDRRWEQAFGALKILGDESDVSARLNDLASSQIDLDLLPTDDQEFVLTVMGQFG